MTEYHVYAILLVLTIAGAIRIGFFCGLQVGRRDAWREAWDAGFKEAERQERGRQERQVLAMMQRHADPVDDELREMGLEPKRERPSWIRRVK